MWMSFIAHHTVDEEYQEDSVIKFTGAAQTFSFSFNDNCSRDTLSERTINSLYKNVIIL